MDYQPIAEQLLQLLMNELDNRSTMGNPLLQFAFSASRFIYGIRVAP